MIYFAGYTTAAQLACTGRSAGGLLMGVVANMRPDLFTAMVAGVPFVDLMVTMCDPSIPLTVTEWEEWGNPNEKEYFDYMMSYSPMDNIQEKVRKPPVCANHFQIWFCTHKRSMLLSMYCWSTCWLLAPLLMSDRLGYRCICSLLVPVNSDRCHSNVAGSLSLERCRMSLVTRKVVEFVVTSSEGLDCRPRCLVSSA